MNHYALIVLRLGVVAAGSVSALWCIRLASRSPETRRSYLLLAFGLGLVAFGSVIEGALFEFAGWDLTAAHTAEAVVSAVGFGLVLLAFVLHRG